jgi:hypothetical protein
MRKIGLWLPILALALVRPAAASPGFLGPTGLLNTPSATTLPMAAYDVYFYGADPFLSYGVNFGITSAIEVGGGIFDPDNNGNEGLINGKYAITKETTSTPGIAVGVLDLVDSLDMSPYLVLTKGFGRVAVGGSGSFGLRGHVGFGTGLFDDNIFGGAELLFSDRLALIGEYDGNDVNFGASFRLGRGVEVKGGLLDADEFVLGVSYSAGLR